VRVYKGAGLGSFYLQVFRDLKSFGVPVTVRGKSCIEYPEPVTFVYEQAGACWMNIPYRRLNPFFALAEVVWILSGNGNAQWIAKYNKQMMEYNDGEEDNHGAYGKRLRNWPGGVDQIKWVALKLKKDNHSRQAVISLWDPIGDNLKESKDHPCNNWVGYRLRNQVLDQTVVIRSNDFIWGAPYNAIQFTHLHALVAGELGVQMGKLTYVIQNLHYYTDLYPEALGAIEEAAAFGNTEAKCIEGFGPVTDADFKHWTLRDVELGIISRGDDYWKDVVPRTIGLYTFIKELQPTPHPEHIRIAAEVLNGLPDILYGLALDFYSKSSNPVIQEVLKVAYTLTGIGAH
jgi:hypothetical protein